MNTFLSEEDQSVKAHFENFAQEQLAPLAPALEARKTDLKDFLQRVGQSGLFSITVPKEFGGQGNPFLHVVLLAEAIGAYDPGFALSLAAQVMAIELIKQFGSEAQRAKYLPLLSSGEISGTLAYFETDSLEPFFGTQAKVSNKVLSGVKNLVVNAGIAQLVIVLASEEVKENQQSLGFWLVENSRRPNVSISALGPYLGLRSAYLEKVELTGYPVKEDDRLGGGDVSADKAKKAYDFALSVGKTIMAAAAVGMLERMLGEAAKSTQQAQLHGAPANQSQGLQWRLADVATEASAGRLLTYRAAWSKDEDGEEFLKYSAMCKLFTAKAARMHSGEAMQVLGLLATAADSHAEKTYRDAKMFELCLGSNDEERVLLGRELGI